MITREQLPNDTFELKGIVCQLFDVIEEQKRLIANQNERIDAQMARIEEQSQRIDQLTDQVNALKRHQFGKRSEKNPKEEEKEEEKQTEKTNSQDGYEEKSVTIPPEKEIPHTPTQVIEEEFESKEEIVEHTKTVENQSNKNAEEENDDFFFINPENQNSQMELGALLHEGNVQDKILDQETLARKTLRLLKINPQNLSEEELGDLETIVKVEGTWRNYLVWSNLEILIHKALFALTTNKHAVNTKKQKKACAPLWLHGGPLPLEDRSAIKRNVILKTAGNALEEGILEPLSAILLAGMGYQIYDMIKTKTWKFNLKFLADFYFNKTDSTSYIAVFNMLDKHPALFALFAGPLVFALFKTTYNMFQLSEPTEEGVNETIKKVKDRSPKWDWKIFSALSYVPLLSSFLMFHPTKSKIPSLVTLILWEGNSSLEARNNALTAIIDLAQTRKGLTQMTALEGLARIAHGLNVRNLMLQPHEVEGVLKIKLRAFHALKEIYKDLPYLSLNKLRTAVLLWEIGQSPSWRVSISVLSVTVCDLSTLD